MKKLLMTLGIILGLTAAVSAQSPEAKPAEALASKPVTKPVATEKVVLAEKPVSKVTPAKVAKNIDASSKAKPVAKEKVVKPDDVETGMQAKESKPAKEKN